MIPIAFVLFTMDFIVVVTHHHHKVNDDDIMGFSHIDNNWTVCDIDVVTASHKIRPIVVEMPNNVKWSLFLYYYYYYFIHSLLLFRFVQFCFVSFCLHSSCLPIENEIVEHWSASLGWLDAHLLLGIFYDEFPQVHTIFYVSALCFVESTMALFILRLLLPNTNNEKYFNYHRYFDGWFFFHYYLHFFAAWILFRWDCLNLCINKFQPNKGNEIDECRNSIAFK